METIALRHEAFGPSEGLDQNFSGREPILRVVPEALKPAQTTMPQKGQLDFSHISGFPVALLAQDPEVLRSIKEEFIQSARSQMDALRTQKIASNAARLEEFKSGVRGPRAAEQLDLPNLRRSRTSDQISRVILRDRQNVAALRKAEIADNDRFLKTRPHALPLEVNIPEKSANDQPVEDSYLS